MLPVGDTSILGIILEELRTQGFHDVRISVNCLKEIIMDYVGDGQELGLDVSKLNEDQPLGTAGAIASVKQSLNEAFIVMNSDLLAQVDLRGLLRFHKANDADATISVREHVIQMPFGVVDVEGNSILVFLNLVIEFAALTSLFVNLFKSCSIFCSHFVNTPEATSLDYRSAFDDPQDGCRPHGA
jgi:NDP-sugar pyrophosphorylase family protein